jgi:CDP-glucose 4,6-dehydratase
MNGNPVMQNGKPGKMELTSVFSGKKIFITGHTGFKGSWLLMWLRIMGAELKGYALKPESPDDLYYSLRGDELCQSVIADIRDIEKLTTEILNFQPDYIFHLAAQPLVSESYLRPLYTLEVNAQGSANVLEALRQLKKPCVAVMITTDKVYSNKEEDYHYKENDKLGGYDPYSASKACAEIIISSFRNSFFNTSKYNEHHKSVSSARAGNVVGGGDWAKDRIIPDTVRAFSENKEVLLRNPSAIRPWQHVLDPLYGYLLLAAKQKEDPAKYSDSFNFGPDKTDCYTVEDIVKQAIQYWGSGGIIKTGEPVKFHEAGLLQLDNSKAKNNLGWHPAMDGLAAVKKTIEWYHSVHHRSCTAREITESQIKEFMQSI